MTSTLAGGVKHPKIYAYTTGQYKKQKWGGGVCQALRTRPVVVDHAAGRAAQCSVQACHGVR